MSRARVLWLLVSFCCAVPAALGCRSSALYPATDVCEGATDTLLTVCAGHEVLAPGGVMRVAFLGVPSDSRCPVDVQCVWAGNAAVVFGVAFGAGPTVPYVLNTGLEPRAVTLGSLRLTLAELRPAPVSTARIPPDRYVASLRLERLPGTGVTRN